MRAVDYGSPDKRKNRLKKKNRPKIRSADPESIARIRKFELFILSQTRGLYPPRSAEKKKIILYPGSEVQSVLTQLRVLYPPRSAGTHLNPRISADFFFRPKSGGAFCAPEFGPKTMPPALDPSSIWDVYRNTFALSFIAHGCIGSWIRNLLQQLSENLWSFICVLCFAPLWSLDEYVVLKYLNTYKAWTRQYSGSL